MKAKVPTLTYTLLYYKPIKVFLLFQITVTAVSVYHCCLCTCFSKILQTTL